MSGGCYQSSPRGKEGRCIRGHNAAYRHDEATEAEGEQAKEGKWEMPSMIYKLCLQEDRIRQLAMEQKRKIEEKGKSPRNFM